MRILAGSPRTLNEIEPTALKQGFPAEISSLPRFNPILGYQLQCVVVKSLESEYKAWSAQFEVHQSGHRMW